MPDRPEPSTTETAFEPPARTGSRRVRRLAYLGAAIILVAIFAWPRLQSRGKEPASAPAPAASAATPAAVPVTVAEVKRERLTETLSTSGSLRANEWVEVTSEISGKVVDIRFDEGSRAGAGDLLVKIDDSELIAQLERAKFRARLAAEREAQQKRLFDEGIISQEEFDRQASERNVLDAEQRLIEAQLKKTEIRAPFAGTLGLRSVSLGAYLSPQTRITTLQDIQPIKLDFSLPEKYAGLVRVGQEVTFRLKGDETPRQARIFAIEPTVDLETRSLLLRAESPNPDGSLLPGAFADVEVAVRSADDALAVPSIAIVPELGGKKVFVVDGGIAQPRPVETGIRTSELVEITSGLAPGEKVITSGLLQIKPGARVEVQ